MAPQPHVVLLGDSIFANGAYTGGAPDVTGHLRSLLPTSWRATLCAVDGATSQQLASQLRYVPHDATHLVIAIGGNDALQNSDVLSMHVTSAAQALESFAERVATFERGYRSAIREAMALRCSPIVCTIYNGALEPARATIARVGLAMFNDVILRTATDLRLDVLELRAICGEVGDYVNGIEPSDQGGLKIARAIACAVGATNGAAGKPGRLWGKC